MDMINLVENGKLQDHQVVAYAGLDEGELVVAIERKGLLHIRLTISPHRPPQIMIVDPIPERSR